MNRQASADRLWKRLKTAPIPPPVAPEVESVMRAVRAIGPLTSPARGLPELAWPAWTYAAATAGFALLTFVLFAQMAQWGQARALAAFMWAPEIQDIIHAIPQAAL